MTKIIRESIIKESYGAGFSMSSGGHFSGGMGGTTRGGFGGSWNSGGPSSMYTYEVKPLSHNLEQLPTVTADQVEQIQLGSKIIGETIRSNAYTEPKKITGIVHKIVTTNDGALKYYVVLDQDTATFVKLEPTSVKLIVEDPVKKFYDAPDLLPMSKRRQRKFVSESIEEYKRFKNI